MSALRRFKLARGLTILSVRCAATADSYLTDGKLLASGVFGGTGSVLTTAINNGTSTSMQSQVSYAPVLTQCVAASSLQHAVDAPFLFSVSLPLHAFHELTSPNFPPP